MNLDLLEERTLLSAVVHPLFDLAAVTTSPFPTDRFTVADTSQNTGRHVNLPLPEQATNPSDYNDTLVINTLDGFNLQPRLSIPFDGLIDVNSVNSQSVFLVRMGDPLDPCDHDFQVVGINQIVWDPATNNLHVESDDLLEQHTRYALIVTSALQDASGHPVEATKEFRLAPLKLLLSRDPVLRSYGLKLVEGLVAAYCVGVRPQDIVGASVFTTQSATAVLEKIRDQIHAATPAPADFLLGPEGSRTVFNLNVVTGITLKQQTKVGQPPTTVQGYDPLALLRVIPGKPDVVGQVAFGKYSSPDYIKVPAEAYIPPVGTRTGEPVVWRSNDIYFTLFLPSGTPPAGGWPVAIWGHGGSLSKDAMLAGVPAVAAKMAENGIATIGINAVGNGYGPGGTLSVTLSGGSSATFPSGGRGIDQNVPGEDGYLSIGASEGFNTSDTSPQAIIYHRDGTIQTAADLMQLVRVIETGIDVDGDGAGDLDPSRIYFAGASAGGFYGTPFLAVEPSVGAGVLNVVGSVELRRLGVQRAATATTVLASRTPSLINAPGIKILDGLSVTTPYFNENMPLRDGIELNVSYADGTTGVIKSPVTNTVPGAMAIQKVFDDREWVSQSGNPVAYAPHLRKYPLLGVPAKSVIIQFAKGDQNIPNPMATALLRAGDLADRATFYRYDRAFVELQKDPGVSNNPHTFIALITSTNPTVKAIALGTQQQIATFFASDGVQTIQPPGVPVEYFEVPIQGPLPEGLNFVFRTTASAVAQALVSVSQTSGPLTTDTANDGLTGELLTWSLATTYVPAGDPRLPAVTPNTPMIDRALDALAPFAWLEYSRNLDDLAAVLLRPARRRR